jgi:hypothetical protein
MVLFGTRIRLGGDRGLRALRPSLTQLMMTCGASLPLCGRSLKWSGPSAPNPKALLSAFGKPCGKPCSSVREYEAGERRVEVT